MSKSSGKKRKQARLGELLLDTGLIAPHQLSVALGQQAKWGGKLGSELIRLGFIGETELAYILEKQLGRALTLERQHANVPRCTRVPFGEQQPLPVGREGSGDV